MKTRPFPPARPHGELREVLPGVHLVSGSMHMGPMRFSRNMTVLVDGDRLVLVNSVRLDDRGLAALDALGRVTDVIRLAGFHGSDDPFYKDRYDCTVHAVKGMTYFEGLDPKKGAIYFEPDRLLDADSELPFPDAALYVFDTEPSEAILHVPVGGGTLVTGDSLQNWARPDPQFNLLAKVAMRFMGFIKPHQIGPGWVKQLKPDKARVRGILDLAFVNVLPGHGTPVLGGAPESYRPAIEAYAGAG